MSIVDPDDPFAGALGAAPAGVKPRHMKDTLEQALTNDLFSQVSHDVLLRDGWRPPSNETAAQLPTHTDHRPRNSPGPATRNRTLPELSSFSWPWGANLPPPLAVKVLEGARLIGASRSGVYRLLQEGKLRAVKRGATLLILTDSLAEHIASLPPATFGAPSSKDTDRT